MTKTYKHTVESDLEYFNAVTMLLMKLSSQFSLFCQQTGVHIGFQTSMMYGNSVDATGPLMVLSLHQPAVNKHHQPDFADLSERCVKIPFVPKLLHGKEEGFIVGFCNDWSTDKKEVMTMARLPMPSVMETIDETISAICKFLFYGYLPTKDIVEYKIEEVPTPMLMADVTKEELLEGLKVVLNTKLDKINAKQRNPSGSRQAIDPYQWSIDVDTIAAYGSLIKLYYPHHKEKINSWSTAGIYLDNFPDLISVQLFGYGVESLKKKGISWRRSEIPEERTVDDVLEEISSFILKHIVGCFREKMRLNPDTL